MDPIQTGELLKTAAHVVLSLKAENAELTEKLAKFQRQEQAEEVVELMETRGLIDPQTPHREKVASVLASGKDLQVVKEALSLTRANMSFAKVASISAPSSNPGSQLESYLMGHREDADY